MMIIVVVIILIISITMIVAITYREKGPIWTRVLEKATTNSDISVLYTCVYIYIYI